MTHGTLQTSESKCRSKTGLHCLDIGVAVQTGLENVRENPLYNPTVTCRFRWEGMPCMAGLAHEHSICHTINLAPKRADLRTCCLMTNQTPDVVFADGVHINIIYCVFLNRWWCRTSPSALSPALCVNCIFETRGITRNDNSYLSPSQRTLFRTGGKKKKNKSINLSGLIMTL